MSATPHLTKINKFLIFVLTLALLTGLVVMPSFADSPSFSVTFDYLRPVNAISGVAARGSISSSSTNIAEGYYFAVSPSFFSSNGDDDISYTFLFEQTGGVYRNHFIYVGSSYQKSSYSYYYYLYMPSNTLIDFISSGVKFTDVRSFKHNFYGPSSLDFYPAGSPGEPIDPSDPSSPLVPSDGKFPSQSVTSYVKSSTQTVLARPTTQYIYYSNGDKMSEFSYPTVWDYKDYPSTIIAGAGAGKLLGSTVRIRQFYSLTLPDGYCSIDWSSLNIPQPTWSGYDGYLSPSPTVQAQSGSFTLLSRSQPMSRNVPLVNGYYHSSGSVEDFYVDFVYSTGVPFTAASVVVSAVSPSVSTLNCDIYSQTTSSGFGGQEIPSIAPSTAPTDPGLASIAELLSRWYMQDAVNNVGTYSLVAPNSDNTSYTVSFHSGNTYQAISAGFLNTNLLLSGITNQNVFMSGLSQQQVGQLQAISSQLSSIGYLVNFIGSQFTTRTGEPFTQSVFELYLQSQFQTAAQQSMDIRLGDILDILQSTGGGSSSSRPWEDFEDSYIESNQQTLSDVENSLTNSNAKDILSDISSGDFSSAGLGDVSSSVSGGSAYGLWSDTTNNAFNGDVDEWYSSWEERVSSW